MAARKQDEKTVEILRLEKATAKFYVIGTSPLIMNRLPKKTREYLLLPPRRQNRAARESVLKHDPYAEYRDAIYRCRDPKAPTLCHMPDNCFKKAMTSTALDMPGASKAQVGRLVSCIDETLHIWGKPYLYMRIVKQAGFRAAPDVRTRAIFPRWACLVNISYFPLLISQRDVLNLFASAGLLAGIGDGRNEKGSFSYGAWEVVGADNKDWNAIVHAEARKVQEQAMATPQAFDADTEELLAWYQTETHRRGVIVPPMAQLQSQPQRRRRNGGKGVEMQT
jgi:hypothetical protein